MAQPDAVFCTVVNVLAQDRSQHFPYGADTEILNSISGWDQYFTNFQQAVGLTQAFLPAVREAFSLLLGALHVSEIVFLRDFVLTGLITSHSFHVGDIIKKQAFCFLPSNTAPNMSTWIYTIKQIKHRLKIVWEDLL